VAFHEFCFIRVDPWRILKCAKDGVEQTELAKRRQFYS
jgi:hypothetical protein